MNAPKSGPGCSGTSETVHMARTERNGTEVRCSELRTAVQLISIRCGRALGLNHADGRTESNDYVCTISLLREGIATS